MKVILKEDDEAYTFLKAEIQQMVKAAMKEILNEVKGEHEQPEDEQWCDTKRAQEILGVQKTKMQELRDNAPENGIQMSKHGRTIRYYLPSLYSYLENHVIK